MLAPDASITLAPTSGAPGSEVRVRVTGFPAQQRVGIGAGPPHSEYEIFAHARTDASGTLSTTVQVPAWAEPGRQLIFAATLAGTSIDVLSEPFQVVAPQK